MESCNEYHVRVKPNHQKRSFHVRGQTNLRCGIKCKNGKAFYLVYTQRTVIYTTASNYMNKFKSLFLNQVFRSQD